MSTWSVSSMIRRASVTAEKLGTLGDLIGADGSSRQFDHRADQVTDLDTLLGKHLVGRLANDLLLIAKLGGKGRQGDHYLGQDIDAGLLDVASRLENSAGLHPRDLGIDDSQATPAMPQHGIEFVQFLHATSDRLGADANLL